jgi:hypothetical protein
MFDSRNSRAARIIVLACPVITLAVLAGRPAAAEEGVQIRPDVVYGHKDGMALTFDIVTPTQSNGAAVLWIQSNRVSFSRSVAITV